MLARCLSFFKQNSGLNQIPDELELDIMPADDAKQIALEDIFEEQKEKEKIKTSKKTITQTYGPLLQELLDKQLSFSSALKKENTHRKKYYLSVVRLILIGFMGLVFIAAMIASFVYSARSIRLFRQAKDASEGLIQVGIEQKNREWKKLLPEVATCMEVQDKNDYQGPAFNTTCHALTVLAGHKHIRQNIRYPNIHGGYSFEWPFSVLDNTLKGIGFYLSASQNDLSYICRFLNSSSVCEEKLDSLGQSLMQHTKDLSVLNKTLAFPIALMPLTTMAGIAVSIIYIKMLIGEYKKYLAAKDADENAIAIQESEWLAKDINPQDLSEHSQLVLAQLEDENLLNPNGSSRCRFTYQNGIVLLNNLFNQIKQHPDLDEAADLQIVWSMKN